MRKVIFGLLVVIGVIYAAPALASSGYMEQTVSIVRDAPKYKYLIHILQLEPSGGFLGFGKKTKFLVQIHGVTTDPGLSPTENAIDETRYLKTRPLVGDLNRIVDELHQTVRSTLQEKDWAALDAAQLSKEIEKIKAQLQVQHATELERQLSEMIAALKAKQAAEKPVLRK